jgi:outer membrane protein insertion porin family
MARNSAQFLIFLLVVMLCPFSWADEKPPAVKLRVSGMGWLENRETRIALQRLWGNTLPATLNANQVEDAVLFIGSILHGKGYLRPSIEVEAVTADGKSARFPVSLTLEQTPPRGLVAKELTFHVKEGVRYFLEKVQIEGLRALSKEAGQDFFFTDVALIVGKGARAYTPAKLNRSADAIESTLRQQGFAQATVRVGEVRENHETGAVSVRVIVEEGPRWELRRLTFDIEGADVTELREFEQRTGLAWSTFRGQDLAEEIRHVYYRRGYPDVRVRLEPKPQPPQDGVRQVDVVARVVTGGHVAVGDIRFRGHEKTKDQVLRRRVELESGDSLDPLKLEQARYRLGRLGVFRSVDTIFEPATGPIRDPVFVLEEDTPREVHLMAGYGSYEQLRGGVEFRQRNLFGRAHRTRFELVQSMKSSRADYTYSVPELLGEQIDGSAKLFGLQREERAFLRQEYGGTVSLSREVPWIGAEGTIGYTFQSLTNDDNELATRGEDERTLVVGSIDITLTRDGRDNPLRPRRGYRWYLQAELASRQLGGDLNYQRIEFGGSYHTSWGRGRWIHAGLSHGVVYTLGSSDRLLPVNKRFYPGGESSIRGFKEGEAAPRGADGRFIGAKAYTLLDIELEQALAGNWSLVAFTDILGTTATLRSYPWDIELVTVGLGIRYQTIIGPIRCEYGHNVRKREDDADGSLHVSVGFPF